MCESWRGWPVVPVHIDDIQPGDTVLIDGAAKTVCRNNINDTNRFMGRTLFGDNYRGGRLPVQKIIIQWSDSTASFNQRLSSAGIKTIRVHEPDRPTAVYLEHEGRRIRRPPVAAVEATVLEAFGLVI